MRYYSAAKKNEIVKSAGKWMGTGENYTSGVMIDPNFQFHT